MSVLGRGAVAFTSREPGQASWSSQIVAPFPAVGNEASLLQDLFCPGPCWHFQPLAFYGSMISFVAIKAGGDLLPAVSWDQLCSPASLQAQSLPV